MGVLEAEELVGGALLPEVGEGTPRTDLHDWA